MENKLLTKHKYKKTALSNVDLSIVIAFFMAVTLVLSIIFMSAISINAVIKGNFKINLPSINKGNNDNQKAEYPFKQTISDCSFVYPDSLGANTDANITSNSFILVDVNTGNVIQSKKSTGEPNRIYPASLTKVMTLIVVYENLKNEDSLKEEITVSEATDNQMKSLGSSGVGFKAGETMTVETAIYALILQSDGWAALTLADYIAGGESAFVELMNNKVQEMGLKDTHFTNVTGLHNASHYSSCYDLAVIMNYAMKNAYCKNVLQALSYKYSTNFKSASDNYTLYHALLVTKLKDGSIQPNTAKIIAGKTGLTTEAGGCLVTFAQSKSNGHSYILVTAKAKNTDTAVNEHLYIYNNCLE